MPPHSKPVLAFTCLYLAAFAAIGIVRGSPELPIYLGLMAVLVPLAWVVHRKTRLPRLLLWAFSLWGLLHMAGGLLPEPRGWFREEDPSILYNWWLLPARLRFDQVVHAYGFGITSWLCWHLMRTSFRGRDDGPLRPTPGVLVICVAFGLGLGALNETIEFIATRVLPDTNIGDFENTGWDLVANLTGTLVAAAVIRWRNRGR